jgi:predicted nuclease with TOPRIM domain
MQGISRSKHVHLMDALLQLETLLGKECECLQQAGEYRAELETMHRNYERLLGELAQLITDYSVLYDEVKIRFLGKKLKELKKEISVEMPDFPMLVQNIRIAYGT